MPSHSGEAFRHGSREPFPIYRKRGSARNPVLVCQAYQQGIQLFQLFLQEPGSAPFLVRLKGIAADDFG